MKNPFKRKLNVVDYLWEPEEWDLLGKAAYRVRKCSESQMLMWADGAASEIMRAVEDYLSHGEEVSLTELREGVITLQAVVKELSLRHGLTQGH